MPFVTNQFSEESQLSVIVMQHTNSTTPLYVMPQNPTPTQQAFPSHYLTLQNSKQ